MRVTFVMTFALMFIFGAPSSNYLSYWNSSADICAHAFGLDHFWQTALIRVFSDSLHINQQMLDQAMLGSSIRILDRDKLLTLLFSLLT